MSPGPTKDVLPCIRDTTIEGTDPTFIARLLSNGPRMRELRFSTRFCPTYPQRVHNLLRLVFLKYITQQKCPPSLSNYIFGFMCHICHHLLFYHIHIQIRVLDLVLFLLLIAIHSVFLQFIVFFSLFLTTLSRSSCSLYLQCLL